jgi:phosphoribosylanthranilate isomerase
MDRFALRICGVEAAPRHKEAAKVREFVEHARTGKATS